MEGKGGGGLDKGRTCWESDPAAPHVHRLQSSADVDLGSERQMLSVTAVTEEISPQKRRARSTRVQRIKLKMPTRDDDLPTDSANHQPCLPSLRLSLQ